MALLAKNAKARRRRKPSEGCLRNAQTAEPAPQAQQKAPRVALMPNHEALPKTPAVQGSACRGEWGRVVPTYFLYFSSLWLGRDTNK
jgi:hypothetical protein